MHVDLESWRVIVEQLGEDLPVSEATVKLLHAGQRIVATAEGSSPMRALDNALRLALPTLDAEVVTLDPPRGLERVVESAKAHFDLCPRPHTAGRCDSGFST